MNDRVIQTETQVLQNDRCYTVCVWFCLEEETRLNCNKNSEIAFSIIKGIKIIKVLCFLFIQPQNTSIYFRSFLERRCDSIQRFCLLYKKLLHHKKWKVKYKDIFGWVLTERMFWSFLLFLLWILATLSALFSSIVIKLSVQDTVN